MIKSTVCCSVFCLVLLLSAFPVASGQSQENIPKQVSDFSEPAQALEYFVKRRKTEKFIPPTTDLVQKFGERKTVSLLEGMVSRADKESRSAVLSTLVDVVSASPDKELRSRTVHRLLSVGLSDSEYRSDLRYLHEFKGSDFNEGAKKLLLDELSRTKASVSTTGIDEGIVLWNGRAGVRAAIPLLRAIDETQRKGEYKPVNPFYQRSALLALARLGEKPAIDEAIRLVDQMPDKEDRAVFVQELAYIHQPEVVEYIKKYLYSDITYETSSLDVVPVAESWYAARALGSMLKGFPKGPIEEQRNWIKDKTEYDFDS